LLQPWEGTICSRSLEAPKKKGSREGKAAQGRKVPKPSYGKKKESRQGKRKKRNSGLGCELKRNIPAAWGFKGGVKGVLY